VLRSRRQAVECVDYGDLGPDLGLSLCLDAAPEATLRLPDGRRIALSETGTIWWRRPRAPEPPPALDDEAREFVRSEWEHFLEGLEPFTCGRWVNPPAAARRASRKALQLVVAHESGLRVPRTAITNDPDAVRELVASGLPLVYKRVAGSPRPVTATQPLRAEDLERLDALPACPAIFQELIEARVDVRVTAIGDELHAAEIDSQAGASTLDWRFDQTVPFRPHELDEATASRLRETLSRLGLVYGAIDLRLTPEGEYVFLEVNPSGQYLFVELLAGLPLNERMAAFLADA
jgi:glutathione synthase/RimK-type ligase-like ATP-grasp enzyme